MRTPRSSSTAAREGRQLTFEPWAVPAPLVVEPRSDLVVAPGEPKDSGASGPWLVLAGRRSRDLDRTGKRRSGDGLRKPLHQVFIDAALDEQSLAGLASRYGLLGTGVRLVDPGGAAASEVVGESVAFWRETISMLRALQELWQDLSDKSGSWLRKYVSWSDEPYRHVEVAFAIVNGRLVNNVGWTFTTSKPDLLPEKDRWQWMPMPEQARGLDDRAADRLWIELFVESAGQQPDVFEARLIRRVFSAEHIAEHVVPFRDGDVHQPIAFFVSQAVNEQLQGNVSLQVGPDSRDGMNLVPRTLLAALYTSFALEMTRNETGLVRCLLEDCGREFRPTRRSQRYCSTACRTKAFYRRTHEAPP